MAEKDESEKKDAVEQTGNLELEKGDQLIGPAAKLTWSQTAAAAGVVTMVQADGEVIGDELSEKESGKKKTPKQYRNREPKLKDIGKKLSMPEKKLFKEAFITDKDRLHKRQQKYNKERNFIVIMEDNVLGKGAATSGKYMVYGSGKIKDKFIKEGIKFDQEQYYMHANNTDFQMEKITCEQTQKRKTAEGESLSKEGGQTKGLQSAKHKESGPKKFKPIKVATPGTFLDQISDNSEDEAT